MQLIDESFFIGEITIASLEQKPVSERLDIFIVKYQKRFLILLLGRRLYDAFWAGITVIGPAEQKWLDLLEYLVDDDLKESPIANYVYWFWMRDNTSQTAGVGEIATTAENSVRVNNWEKMIRAWNEMCDFVHGSKQWFHDYYAEYDFDHDGYYFNSYCYSSYKDEFAHKNTFNL